MYVWLCGTLSIVVSCSKLLSLSCSSLLKPLPEYFFVVSVYCVATYYTSGKIIQLNEYGCRDAPCKKSWKQGYPLSNTIKDTSTIMRNPLPELCRAGLCMSILDSIAKGISLLPRFSIFIQLNDFSTSSTFFQVRV